LGFALGSTPFELFSAKSKPDPSLSWKEKVQSLSFSAEHSSMHFMAKDMSLFDDDDFIISAW
jgi:hypothetical protein